MGKFLVCILFIINIPQSAHSNDIYLGNWKISSIAGYAEVGALSNEEAKSFIGKKYYISKERINIMNEILDNPIFEKTIENNDQFYFDIKAQFNDLGVKGETVTIIDFSYKQNGTTFYWDGPGKILIIDKENNVYTFIGGVFYKLEKLQKTNCENVLGRTQLASLPFAVVAAPSAVEMGLQVLAVISSPPVIG